MGKTTEGGVMTEVAVLRIALEQIKRRAYSEAPAEDLEDAQRDLRHIYAIATKALGEQAE